MPQSMGIASSARKKCIKCDIPRPYANFYKLKTPTDDDPDGYMPLCKSCIEHVYKASEPATFMPILKYLDIPWIPSEYRKIYLTKATPGKPDNLAILGNYIVKMKLKQYKDYSFELSNLAQDRYETEETRDPIENYNYNISLVHLSPLLTSKKNAIDDKEKVIKEEDMQVTAADEISEFSKQDTTQPELTKEEAKYLIMKWGKIFTVDQLLTLEKQYQEMCQDFDIRNASQRNYLKKLCIISLRYDDLLLQQNYEDAKKLSSMYTSITKEAGFQPIQNKTANDDYLNSVSYLVKLAESEGPIPVYDIEENPDIVDLTIKDFKLWVKNLISDDENITERFDVAKQELDEQDKILKEQDYGDEDGGEEGFGIDISVYSQLDSLEEIEESRND